MKPHGYMTHSGKKLRSAAMPLGGIGTGTIAIGGDGLLKQWQITNTIKHLAFVPNSFFAVWVKKVEDSVDKTFARALICSKVHKDADFIPAESVNDHMLGIGAKNMIEIIPGVDEILFDGEYPIAFLKYRDILLPVDITLTAFNPCIPLDPKISGLPVIIFKFHITNSSASACEVALVGSCLNFLGWRGTDIFKGNEFKYFGGNFNKVGRIGSWASIEMKSEMLLKEDWRYGDLTFSIDQENPMITPQWGDLAEFWSQFSQTGALPSYKDTNVSPLGYTWAGSLGSKKMLQPGEGTDIIFTLAWNFPNRVMDWKGTAHIPDDQTEFWVGNRYNEWFRNSNSVITYLQKNWDYLISKTEQFHDVLHSTTLPPAVIAAISAPISTIRAPTCFWIRDGSFHGYEGCHGASTTAPSGGCCPLDCTHVWNYEFTLAHLFPSLERTMRLTDMKLQQEKGFLQHRSVIPLYLPQKGYTWERNPPAIDGMLGFILKSYREYLIASDRELLKTSWPVIEHLFGYIFTEVDPAKKGIIAVEQPNTYDCSLFGINTIIGSLYLAALLAGEKIAEILQIPEWKQKCREVFDSGQYTLDQECWNGEYYIQKYDQIKITRRQYGTGCHSDQLVGQWWAFELGLGYILPQDHVKKAVNSIMKYNFKESFESIKQGRVYASKTDQGLLNCTWPHGGEPLEPILYSSEVWTGIEYEVAALCVYTEDIPSAHRIVSGVRNRYDGSHRNPWNEVECGDHYVRPMSSWTLFHAFTGLDYHIATQQFVFRPKMNLPHFTSFFITNTAWGQITLQNSGKKVQCSISVIFGELKIHSFLLNIPNIQIPIKSSIALDGQNPEEASITVKESEILIQIHEMQIIKEGSQLIIELE